MKQFKCTLAKWKHSIPKQTSSLVKWLTKWLESGWHSHNPRISSYMTFLYHIFIHIMSLLFVCICGKSQLVPNLLTTSNLPRSVRWQSSHLCGCKGTHNLYGSPYRDPWHLSSYIHLRWSPWILFPSYSKPLSDKTWGTIQVQEVSSNIFFPAGWNRGSQGIPCCNGVDGRAPGAERFNGFKCGSNGQAVGGCQWRMSFNS